MIMNEKISKEYLRGCIGGNKDESAKLHAIIESGAVLIDVLPSDKSTEVYPKWYKVGLVDSTEGETKYHELPAELVAGYSRQTNAEKEAFLNSDEYRNMCDVAENGAFPEFARGFIKHINETLTQEEIAPWLELVEHENECGMQFEVWNLYNDDFHCGADIVITDLGRKDFAVNDLLKTEMMKTCFSESEAEDEIERGSFLVFMNMAGAEDNPVDRFLEGGGYPLVNPERKSHLYFLRENGEVFATGYMFSFAEQKELSDMVAEALKEASKTDKNIE